MVGWNGWYHCTSATYGAWLPGDRRGWRSRNHHVDVPYDYKHPPPEGYYDALFDYSTRVMRFEIVKFAVFERGIVRDAVVRSLIDQGHEVVCAAVGAYHMHLLARFPIGDTDLGLGVAKKSAYFALRTTQGTSRRIWAKGSRSEPLKDRDHQLRVVKYILDHGPRGAATWLASRDHIPPRVRTRINPLEDDALPPDDEPQ